MCSLSGYLLDTVKSISHSPACLKIIYSKTRQTVIHLYLPHFISTLQVHWKWICECWHVFVFQFGMQLYQNFIQPHQKQKASPMVSTCNSLWMFIFPIQKDFWSLLIKIRHEKGHLWLTLADLLFSTVFLATKGSIFSFNWKATINPLNDTRQAVNNRLIMLARSLALS